MQTQMKGAGGGSVPKRKGRGYCFFTRMGVWFIASVSKLCMMKTSKKVTICFHKAQTSNPKPHPWGHHANSLVGYGQNIECQQPV